MMHQSHESHIGKSLFQLLFLIKACYCKSIDSLHIITFGTSLLKMLAFASLSIQVGSIRFPKFRMATVSYRFGCLIGIDQKQLIYQS
jgi:hypothetical protein